MSQSVIKLFSPFQVIVAGRPVPDKAWQGRIPRSILKVLALSSRGKTSDELIELFWPDQAVTAARQRLYEVMSRLRRTLHGYESAVVQGGSSLQRDARSKRSCLLETVFSGYRLREDVIVDVRQFHDYVVRVRQLAAVDVDGA